MKRLAAILCHITISCLLYAAVPSAAALEAPAIVSLGRISQGLEVPTGLDVDAAGNLYVADARRRAVLRYDRYGRMTGEFADIRPSGGLAVSADGSRLYVAAGDAVAVLAGDDGGLLGHLGAGAGEFERAYDLAVDGDGEVYVADSRRIEIRVYDEQGRYLRRFGAGRFGMIASLAIDAAAGEVYVADSLSIGTSVKPRIHVFDLAGNPRRTLSSVDHFGPSPITFFGGSAFDRFGRGYFLDPLKNRIGTLALPSTYLGSYDTVGYGVGELTQPLDAVFAADSDRLFVICSGGRIEVFGIDGGQNPVKVNEAPSVPVPLGPAAGAETATASPELRFENAVDADGDELTYEVRVLHDGTVVAEYAGLAEEEGQSAVRLDVALAENERYEWSVRAFDGELASAWSSPQSFHVNALQEAPAPPLLVAPLNGEILDGAGSLAWRQAVDPDPGDTVTYRIEIAADEGFEERLVEEPFDGLSARLAQLPGYERLPDGSICYWRVRSLDNHDLVSAAGASGRFLYDTTQLAVTANMPGARVHLGGNHGFAGRYLGEAPLLVRDLPPGAVSLVVERAGFEPHLTQVRLDRGDNAAVHVDLVPALVPAALKGRPLQADGENIVLSGDACPVAVDYDNDGLIDLLVGDASGALTLYPGVRGVDGEPSFGRGVLLSLPLIPGAAPCVVDWNNDGRKDLLVGGADGTVTLFANGGGEAQPVFAAGAHLHASGAPIAVGAAAAPVVFDLDDDGDKDLVVGSAGGVVRLFINEGSDAEPQLSVAGNLVTLSSPVVPSFVDWDGDGRRELLLAASEHLYRYDRGDDGVFVAVEVLDVGDEGANDRLPNPGRGAFFLGDRLRPFALDLDGTGGKDLIVGNSAGAVRLAASHGSRRVPDFFAALRQKVAQIEALAAVAAPDRVSTVVEIDAAIAAEELKEAARLCRKLREEISETTELARLLGELIDLL